MGKKVIIGAVTRKIVIGADHGGFEMKAELKKYFDKKGIECVDVGMHEFDPLSNFPPIVLDMVKELKASGVEKGKCIGVMICGSGIGISIAMNRHPGIRAALCHSVEYAEMARQHNDANVLCLGGRYLDIKTAERIVQAFLDTAFLDGKYRVRMDLIDA